MNPEREMEERLQCLTSEVEIGMDGSDSQFLPYALLKILN